MNIINTDRTGWTKKAKAVFVESRQPGQYFSVKLMGPSDGSGCLPAGETKVHQTRFRTRRYKAIADAIAFCDGREIRIHSFPSGFGY